MELRELFEKLHPVPEGMYFRGPDYSFDDPVGDTFGCAVYNALWQGFQSGHAAGLEDAAEEVQKHFIRGESLAGLFSSIAAAIRAMKEPK